MNSQAGNAPDQEGRQDRERTIGTMSLGKVSQINALVDPDAEWLEVLYGYNEKIRLDGIPFPSRAEFREKLIMALRNSCLEVRPSIVVVGPRHEAKP